LSHIPLWTTAGAGVTEVEPLPPEEDEGGVGWVVEGGVVVPLGDELRPCDELPPPPLQLASTMRAASAPDRTTFPKLASLCMFSLPVSPLFTCENGSNVTVSACGIRFLRGQGLLFAPRGRTSLHRLRELAAFSQKSCGIEQQFAPALEGV
jgi:hypothetical protein